MISLPPPLTALILLLSHTAAENSFARLISGQVSLSDSSVVEYVSAFDSPVANRYTIFGWVQFTGTEHRLYNILKLRNLGLSPENALTDSLNSILALSYSLNQLENKQFLAVVYANGPKQSDSLAKIIEGPMLQAGVWNFFAVSTDYESLKSKIYIKIFDREALEASYFIALSYKELRLERGYSVFLGKNNEPPNNNENFAGRFYNFYFINNYIERPEILYLFDSSPSLDQFRGVNLDLPLYTTGQNVTTEGLYKSKIAWTNLASPGKYSKDFSLRFSSKSSAKVEGIKIDLSTKVISSVVLFLKFRFAEPISDEFAILRFGEPGQPNSLLVSLVEEAKETAAKTFSQNLSVSAADAQAAVGQYAYRPEAKLPKRLKVQIWSTNGKQATFMSSNDFLPDASYEVSAGYTHYDQNIIRFLYQEQKNYIISAEVKDFVMTSSLKDLTVADNAAKDFAGSLSLGRLLYLDAPIKFTEALFAANSDASSALGPFCKFSTSMIKDFGGCADCGSAAKILNGYACQNFCPLPLKNFNGICQPCRKPDCDVSAPNGAFNITKTGEGQFSAFFDQTLYKRDGSPFKLESANQTFCAARLNNTDPALYSLEIVPSFANSSCQITISPTRTLYDVTLVVEFTLDSRNFYTSDLNELVLGASALLVVAIQTQNFSLEATGLGLAAFLLAVFFISVLLALAYIFLIVPNNYMKWRLLYSINYIHFLALLFFVNTQLPILLNAFAWTLYEVLIHAINGAFSGAILAGYKADPAFSLFRNVAEYPRFVYNGVTQHFVLNFLLIIVLQVIAAVVYLVAKILQQRLRGREKTRASAAISRVVRAFEWNVAYYAFAFFFAEITFFVFLNFLKAHTGFHLVNASIAMAAFYLLFALAFLFFTAYLPLKKGPAELAEKSFRRRWGFLYTNYRQRGFRRCFEAVYHARTLLFMLFLAFALDAPAVQAFGLFVVFVLFFAGGWVWWRPWKSWVMWALELIPEAALGLVLLGYLILALNEKYAGLNSELRANVAAFIVSFCVVGVLANAASIVFWAAYNWRYRPSVFDSYDKTEMEGGLVFQSRELSALNAKRHVRESLESNLFSAKMASDLQGVLPHRDSNFYVSPLGKRMSEMGASQNFSEGGNKLEIENPEKNESEEISPPLKNVSDFAFLDSQNFPSKSNQARIDRDSVQTAEDKPKIALAPPQQKVMDTSSADEDENLDASDSLEVPYARRNPPALQESNLQTQGRFLGEKRLIGEPDDLSRKANAPGKANNFSGIAIPRDADPNFPENAPVQSDEDFY